MGNFLTKAVHTKYGKIIISILLGLGLSTLFRKTCDATNCFKFIAPSVKEIENNVYQHDNNCYKFKAITKKCSVEKEKQVTYV